MECEDFRELIDRYVAGAVTGRPRAEAEQHLRACAECREDLAAAELLASRTARLPFAIAPPREVWPLIRERLVPRRQPPRWRLVAAGIALAAASSGITLLAVRQFAPDSPVADSAQLLAIEARYHAAALELGATLDARESELLPETGATLRRSLAVIDQALAEARAALARDPANPHLETVLRAAYDRKLDLLRRAIVMPRRS